VVVPAGSAAVDLFALESSDARLIDLKPQSTAQDLVESHIPTDMWAALLPHQQQGVLAGIRRGGRLLLADDMGLGKTAQVTAARGGSCTLWGSSTCTS
jgi:SNF2 family DNA or RNA helicase